MASANLLLRKSSREHNGRPFVAVSLGRFFAVIMMKWARSFRSSVRELFMSIVRRNKFVASMDLSSFASSPSEVTAYIAKRDVKWVLFTLRSRKAASWM